VSHTIFSRQLRLLLCPQCGGPIEGGVTGGSTTCRYCGAGVYLAPRDESRDRGAAAAAPEMSEADRFQRLRAQDHKPLIPPPSIQHLMVGGTLPAEYLPQALGEWQRARQEIGAGGSFGAAERLYFLTLLLYGRLAEQRKDAEVRALLETARDLLHDPQHRQVLHGMLARNAARIGDAAAAEEWLGLCNARSQSLVADTAYRFSRAYLSTRRGDFAGVLSVLGQRIDDVPIADGQDEICGLLRANALERTGQGQAAVEQLVQLGAGAPDRDHLLYGALMANVDLGLCPQSFVAARGQVQAMQQSAVRTRGGINVGLLLISVFGVVGAVLALDLGAWAVLPRDVIGVAHTALILGSIACSFAVVFFFTSRARAARERLLTWGAPGRAHVQEVRGTGVLINGQPQLELVLRVQVPGRPPFIALHREVIAHGLRARAVAGASLAVKVDATDNANLAIDWASP
jgi:hypothetical protein